MDQVITWAFDHIAGEAMFRGPDLLLVGDAEILAVAVGKGLPTLTAATGWLDVDDDRALMVKGPGSNRDGPWVWVISSDDGPIASVDISPGLEKAGPADSFVAGSIDVPSGRLVVGIPTSIAWRGAAVEPSGSRQVEMFCDENIPGSLGDYLVVIRLAEAGSCQVEVIPGASSAMVSFVSVTPPTPSWLPEPRPIIDPPDLN
jgi:hypothetical protein